MNWLLFVILLEGPLVVPLIIMVFLSRFLDFLKMSMSKVSYLIKCYGVGLRREAHFFEVRRVILMNFFNFVIFSSQIATNNDLYHI